MASDIEKQKTLLLELLSQLPHRKSWSNLVHLLDSWPDNAEREWAWNTALEKLDALPPHSFLFQLKLQQQRTDRNYLLPEKRRKSSHIWPRKLKLRHLPTPLIRALLLEDIERFGDLFALIEQLHRVYFLDLQSQPTPAWKKLFGEFSTHPAFSRLQEVYCRNASFPWREATTFLSSEHLSELKVLEFSKSNVTQTMLHAIATNPHPTQMQALTIRGGGRTRKMGVQGMQALAQREASPALQHLDLGAQGISDAAAQILAQSPICDNVQSLQLYGNWVQKEGMQAIAESHRFENLTTLNLCSNNFRTKSGGIEPLAQATDFPSLQRLELKLTRLDSAGVRKIASSSWLQQLRHLNLGLNEYDAASVLRLIESGKLEAMEELSIEGCRVNPKTVKALLELPNLKRLCLNHCKLPRSEEYLSMFEKWEGKIVGRWWRT